MAEPEEKILEEELVEQGLITPEQLKEAKEEKSKTGLALRKILVKRDMIKEEAMVKFLSEKLNIPYVTLSNYIIDQAMIELVPEEMARRYQVVPLFRIANIFTIAMVDPLNLIAIDEISLKTGLTIEPVIATEKDIKNGIAQYYGITGSVDDLIKSISETELTTLEEAGEIDIKMLHDIIERAPIIKLVNLLIMRAIKDNASDIHIEPDASMLRIRMRIDGVLHEENQIPKILEAAIVSRIKILANMDIAERRIPQDGRFQVKMGDHPIDLRISTIPTIFGENVVLRLLDPESSLLLSGLESLGFLESILETYRRLIYRPYGIILVTGPTGSGKTTTLYASLNTINSIEKNIITIEDPVEYQLPLVRQIQINPKAGITFANGLRSILRQDPDVIMVGEIRDLETAEIAIQSALTGHLVFSTLHTNDAPGSITRLLDMGVEPFLVASSIIGIVAQRLVRTICPSCRETYHPSAKFLAELGMEKEADKITFYRGKGCSGCRNTGYKGRTAIFELMIPDEKSRHLIISKATSGDIRASIKETQGMKTLREEGVEKVKAYLTTVEEVIRVTQD